MRRKAAARLARRAFSEACAACAPARRNRKKSFKNNDVHYVHATPDSFIASRNLPLEWPPSDLNKKQPGVAGRLPTLSGIPPP